MLAPGRRAVAALALVLTALPLGLVGCGSPYAEEGSAPAGVQASVATLAPEGVSEDELYDVGTYMSADAKPPVGPQVDEGEPASGKIRVAAVIDTKGVDGAIMAADTALELDEGATAYDALAALAGEDLVVQETESGKIIMGVGGVANGDHGNASAWMYGLNGELSASYCDRQELTDGDSVVFFYVTGDL